MLSSGDLGVHRFLAVDDPTHEAADSDPLLLLTWIDGHGVKCEAVVVGVVATALVRFQAAVAFVPDWPATGLLTTVARYEQLQGRRLDVSDYDLQVEILGYRQRLTRTLKRLWLKIREVR